MEQHTNAPFIDYQNKKAQQKLRGEINSDNKHWRVRDLPRQGRPNNNTMVYLATRQPQPAAYVFIVMGFIHTYADIPH